MRRPISPGFSISKAPDVLSQAEVEKIIPERDIIAISRMYGGHSTACLYKVETSQNKYAIRHTSGIFGPEQIRQEFSITQQAADLGCSPKIFHQSIEKGIVVMEYIDNELPPGRSVDTLRNIPNANSQLMKQIREVHQKTKIASYYTPRIPIDYVRSSAENIPAGFLSAQDQAILDRIIEIPFPLDEQVVTHNDFRSGNLLYNDGRFWMIDWELSGINHPFYDVAYFANYQDMSCMEGKYLLEEYLQKTPSRTQLNTYDYLRRLAYVFSATLALPGLADHSHQLEESKGKEIPFKSVAEVWQQMDDGILDIEYPADEYQISLFLLRKADTL